MPETTETATFARSPEDVFDHLADFGRLAEWDPMFDRSERLDDGPLGVGSRFRTVGSVFGREFELDLEIVEYERPDHVVLHGESSSMTTRESIRVEPHPDGGSEVTYTSSFETSAPDLIDAATKPAFVVVGKKAIGGMRDWLGS